MVDGVCAQAKVHTLAHLFFSWLPGLTNPPVLFAACSQVGLPGFNPMSFLSSEAELLTWQDQGLPRDTLSAQNALAILHGVHTPFIIDPSSQVWHERVMVLFKVLLGHLWLLGWHLSVDGRLQQLWWLSLKSMPMQQPWHLARTCSTRGLHAAAAVYCVPQADVCIC
jgi:hypothetical protein